MGAGEKARWRFDMSKCPECGSDKFQQVVLCLDCGHRQFLVKPENTRETELHPWQATEYGKKKKKGGNDE